MKKRCTGCKEMLPLASYYKNKTTDDGKSIYCKGCTKLNAKKYYQKKILKQIGETNGITVSDALFPSNFTSLGGKRAELTLKIAMIQRLMLTINSELNELLKNYRQEEMSS